MLEPCRHHVFIHGAPAGLQLGCSCLGWSELWLHSHLGWGRLHARQCGLMLAAGIVWSPLHGERGCLSRQQADKQQLTAVLASGTILERCNAMLCCHMVLQPRQSVAATWSVPPVTRGGFGPMPLLQLLAFTDPTSARILSMRQIYYLGLIAAPYVQLLA